MYVANDRTTLPKCVRDFSGAIPAKIRPIPLPEDFETLLAHLSEIFKANENDPQTHFDGPGRFMLKSLSHSFGQPILASDPKNWAKAT